jgi:hypothetical protein
MANILFRISLSGDLGSTDIPFSEVSGLTQEVQLIEYRDGSSPDYSTVKMPAA